MLRNQSQNNNSSEVKISFYKKLCRKKWFKIARPIIIILLIILVIYLLTIFGVFKIKNIETENQLKYVTNIEQITNQYKGVGYFSLNLEKLEEEIQNSSKYVKSVSAEKIFPNKILLKVEEYKPEMYMEYKDICYTFSQEGLILSESSEYEECKLDNGVNVESTQNILADGKLIFGTEIDEIIKILEEFGWIVTTLKFDKNVLEVTDGERIITLEVNEEYDEQLARMYLVLEKANIESLDYKSIDLRFERPVMELL
jgi:hypothetical protein